MKRISDIDKRIIQSLFNSGQMAIETIADEYDCSVKMVKLALAEDIKPSCIDRLEIDLGRGKVIILDVPCYGTLSYDDVSTIQDAIFNHYFPGESNEVPDID